MKIEGTVPVDSFGLQIATWEMSENCSHLGLDRVAHRILTELYHWPIVLKF